MPSLTDLVFSNLVIPADAQIGDVVCTVSGFSTPIFNAVILLVGDSIGVGYQANGYVAIEHLGYGAGVTYDNQSVSGHAITDIAADLGAGGYAQFYDAARTCLCVIPRGTNDLGNNGASAQATYSALEAEVAKAKADGFYVAVCTLLPRTDFPGTAKEQARLDYNSAVRANAASADYIIDLASNPDMGPDSAASDTSKYADGLHPTQNGQILLEPTYKAVTDVALGQPPRAATVSLGPLTLSGSLVSGTASTGTILGATNGSAIASNLTGLSVSSSARTYSWNGAGGAGTTANGLVETLAGATGSPKASAITVAPAGESYLRLTTIHGLTESADGSGGFDYVAAAQDFWATNPGQGGYPSTTLPANTDGYILLPVAALGRSGVIVGFSTSMTPQYFTDLAFGTDVDDYNGNTTYPVLLNGSSGAVTNSVAMAVSDLIRIRRSGSNGLIEISRDGGSSFPNVVWTGTVTTAALKPFFQSGNNGPNGVITRPRQSATLA